MDARDEKVGGTDIPGRRRVGDLLRERRIELGLTQADIAHIVKLPARRIDAMECERWSELPDGPYLRGFLRNVAKALDLDPAELVARVDAAHGDTPAAVLVAPGATHITLPRRSGPADDRHGGRKLVFGAFAFAIVAAVIAWSGTDSFERAVASARALMDRKPGDPTVASAPPAKDASATVPAGSASVAAVPSVTPATGPADDAGATTAKAPVIASSTPTASEVLRFHFNDQSWVEVRSSDGTVLLHGLNAAGSEQAVDGDPPFALVVGNAKGVVLRFRGQPVDLAPYTRDSVARFTLS